MSRTWLLVLAVGILATAVARAQAPARSARIAALLVNDSAAGRATLATFQQRLEQLGWAIGRDARIDDYFGGGESRRTAEQVATIVQTKPDVILSVGTIGVLLLRERKVTTPIVFVQVTDPVAEGHVRSLERPGGNITGFANIASAAVGRERVRLLKSVAPGVTRVLLVYDAAYPTVPGLIEGIRTEALSQGMDVHAGGMRDGNDYERAIGEFGSTGNGALIALPDGLTSDNAGRIIRAAERHRLPAVYPLAAFADAGGLLSYGINVPVMWEGAASYVNRILRGEQPGDLPVQEPAAPEIVVNLAAAKRLGLSMPETVLRRATRTIP